MPRPKARKLSKKEVKAQAKRRHQATQASAILVEPVVKSEKIIELPQVIPVRKLSEIAQIPVTKVLETLLKNGLRVTINESIDFETAAIIGQELGLQVKAKGTGAQLTKSALNQAKLTVRPPIVTVMGHVDHGKTKLLDALRRTNLAEKESGGITQHIGAYQVSVKEKGNKTPRLITFLDTPGHEAFSALRAHGANITDIVVLVIAADDGVKPQTLEALSHAKAANVPIIVAINKIDLPQANPEKVKRQLAEINLMSEQWGGRTPVVEVSAKTGQGIDHLLEIILLAYDLNPAKTDLTAQGSGVIIEAHLNPKAGPLVTALATQGVLKISDIIAAGRAWGKIRSLRDDEGKPLKQVFPGTPVTVVGLKSLPEFGDTFQIADSESAARELVSLYSFTPKVVRIVKSQAASDQEKKINIIVKADVTASLVAITSTLAELKNDQVAVEIVLSGVGPVSETDVKMAYASDAWVLAFRVPVSQVVEKLAQSHQVKINQYDVIYQLIDEVKSELKLLVRPKFLKRMTGRLPVQAVFMQAKPVAIVGGKVAEGKVATNDYVTLMRQDQELGQAKIISVQVSKTAVPQATVGQECGLKLAKDAAIKEYKIKPNDVLVTYELAKAP